MGQINCSVNSCAYWGKGNVCEADAIMVQNNQGQDYSMEIGTMVEMSAETSAETCCETFKPKKEKAGKKS